MLLGKQRHLITRCKKCTRQARTQKSKSSYPMSPPIPWPHPLASILSVNLYAHIASRQATIFHARSHHPFPAAPLQPRRPQPSAQPSSLISGGFFSPPISSHSLAPMPSAAVRTILRPHFPSAAVSSSRRETWEHQNEPFVQDFLQFLHFVASKSTYSYEFS